MKRKLMAFAAAGILSIAALAGCSSASDTAEDTASNAETEAVVEIPEVEQRTVYVIPEWVNAAANGEVEGYEDILVAQVEYDESTKANYDQGHVPGAILVTDVDIEDAVGDEEQPYNLLDNATLEENILARGITKDTKVVLYGADVAGVARVAYALIYAGVEDVKIIDGGLDAWQNAGFDIETTENKPEKAEDFGTTIPAHPEYYTTMQDAIDNSDSIKLVSIRSEEEWLGTTSGYSYIDRAGEPEGAVWGKGCDTAFDVNGFANSDLTVLTLDEIMDTTWSDVEFALDDSLAFYCGTGWRAAVPFLIMYQNGYDNISLYDGGWYEWQMHGDNKVQVGDPASNDCKHTTVDDLPTNMAAAA